MHIKKGSVKDGSIHARLDLCMDFTGHEGDVLLDSSKGYDK